MLITFSMRFNLLMFLLLFPFGVMAQQDILKSKAEKINNSFFTSQFYNEVYSDLAVDFKLGERDLRILQIVSNYNSNFSQVINKYFIRPRFDFNSIANKVQISFYFLGRRTELAFDRQIKNGLLINGFAQIHSSNYFTVSSVQSFINSKKNGVSICLVNSDSVYLEEKIYKNGFPNGDYLNYCRNGNICDSGKLISKPKQGFDSVFVYNRNGEVKDLLLERRYFEVKVGIWKKFNCEGEIISEDIY